MSDFEMPSLGADMDAGTLVEWLVDVGDRVERGQVVCVVETQKGAIDVEIWQDGTIEELLVEPGQEVPVHTPLARIADVGMQASPDTPADAATEPPEMQDDEESAPTNGGTGPATVEPADEAPGAPAASLPTQEAPPSPPTDEAGSPVVPEGPSDLAPAREEAGSTTADVRRPEPTADSPKLPDATSRPRVSPLARRHAAEQNIDVAALFASGHGSGPRGAVLLADVEAHRDAPAPTPGASATSAAPPPEHRRRVTPVARKLAEAHDVNLQEVTGTGAGGAVTREDVARAACLEPTAESPPTAEPRSTRDTATTAGDAMRKAIAAAMARSKREIPHFYLATRIDMEAALDHVTRLNASRPVSGRVLPGALIARAVALSLRDHPRLNGYWRDDAFVEGDGIHVGFAVALRDGGLVAPALIDADQQSVDELMGSLKDLVRRARTGRLKSSEMTRATITVTALGDDTVDTVYGVIYPPQVALVGCGAPRPRPWVGTDGGLTVRRVMHVTLSADHRALDGRAGSQFLSTLQQHLEHPESLYA